MDVVRRNINDLGGHVQILSVPGRGSTIRIRLPLTLAILEGQMLRVGKEIYVASLVSIIETVQSKREDLSCVAGRTELFKHRSDYLPIIRRYDLFGIEPDSRDITDGLLVVLEADGRRVAMLVDELLAQQQVVIKSLETNFKQVPGLAGATIHGDGTVALILDVAGIGQNVPRASIDATWACSMTNNELIAAEASRSAKNRRRRHEPAVFELLPGRAGVCDRYTARPGNQGVGHGYSRALFAQLHSWRHQSSGSDRSGG